MTHSNNHGSSHLPSEGRPYVLAVWLGFFVAGLLIPNGYMPSVAQDGSLQFILCSATGGSLPSDSTDHDSNDICPFALEVAVLGTCFKQLIERNSRHDVYVPGLSNGAVAENRSASFGF